MWFLARCLVTTTEKGSEEWVFPLASRTGMLRLCLEPSLWETKASTVCVRRDERM